ncbi:T9SS type A sorting domain-containing protein, partial [candidate division WOR-3 bacterium]|nr:T9SS type A sorting domain-containing protein [candidate division WOR-3 bacterium]
SGRPWDETYRGPSPFSEPETQLVRDFLATFRPRDCMDLHSFGQYNMYPWGYSTAEPPDQAVLRATVDTFQSNNGYPLPHTGQVNWTIYPCNGMSVDWEYSDTAGKFVTYAFTCELGTTDFWYGWLDSAYVNRECDLNVPNLYYLARVAGVWFQGLSARLDDSLTGNGDGRIDPDELSGIWFTVRNQAIHPLDSAYGITARLTSLAPDVQVLDSVASFPNAARGAVVDNHTAQFRIRTSPAVSPGAHVPLRLELSFTDAGQTYTQTVDFMAPTWRQPVSAATAPAGAPRLSATPNPAASHVRFSTLPVTTACSIDIFSPAGSLVASRAISGKYTWNCSSVPAGVYFCRLTAGGQNATTRICIVH